MSFWGFLNIYLYCASGWFIIEEGVELRMRISDKYNGIREVESSGH
jgi:hypothetical protein